MIKQSQPVWLSNWRFEKGRVIGTISYDARFGSNKQIRTSLITGTNSENFCIFTKNGSQYYLGEPYLTGNFQADWKKITDFVKNKNLKNINNTVNVPGIWMPSTYHQTFGDGGQNKQINSALDSYY